MATLDAGQIRSICQSLPANQRVVIQAGTLLGLVNLVKTLQGSEAALAVSTVPTDRPEYDLTRWGG